MRRYKPKNHRQYWNVVCPYCAAKKGQACFYYSKGVKRYVTTHIDRVVLSNRSRPPDEALYEDYTPKRKVETPQ